MKTDIIIIGGGIVGLSTAYQLLQLKPDLSVSILEKENAVAKHQTGNNSGVIHSGIYYKPGSLKAQNCLRGYDMLIDFCKAQNIEYDLCGKIIVAIKPEEIAGLEALYQRGIQNGLSGLRFLSKDEIKQYEPNCVGIKGIFVPQTGIVDYKQIAVKLAENINQNANGNIILNSKIQAIVGNEHGAVVHTDTERYEARLVINCAGLYCDKVAAMAGEKLNMKIIPFRGEYYAIKPEKAYLVKNLIYPVPDPNFPFLGVHFTRRISGEIEAGPNAVFAFQREGYKKTDFKWSEFWDAISFAGFRKVASKYWKTGLGEYHRSYFKPAFVKALQQLVPSITEDDLIPAGAGVRAQACDKDGGLIDDFYIQESTSFIHVLNAPSPAATSSLSIGLEVAERSMKKLN
ncbi:MAG: L-2-hydroxyglutarate oxidase [Bacteroidetes bacterium]|nr:L-2-hydroxyglutarate oxidase [Bacteroidota bacterium]MDA1224926.1 L-2-hydroxyglutarate oxidase [Bacteroidota bacterium]